MNSTNPFMEALKETLLHLMEMIRREENETTNYLVDKEENNSTGWSNPDEEKKE